jgi:cell wall-associated NlpC family hydrolase
LAGQSPAAVAVNPQSAVQKSAVSVLDQIKAGSQRQAALYKQAAANRVRSQGAGNVGNVGGSGTINYTPNGALGAGRNRVLALASSYVGRTPYVFGGTSYSGIDCSGLVKAVYASAGYNLPHSAAAEGRIMGQKTSIANLRPGDIVAWNDGSHIAIYAGNGQIIEAAHPGSNVRVHNIWSNAVYGIRVSLPGD